MAKLLKLLGIFCFLLLAAGKGWAVSIDFVPVGDTGNAADERTGHGRVDYNYAIGKYGVTAGQYCEFLNAVATESDAYGLYDSKMEVTKDDYWGCNIIRNTLNGKSSYSVAADWANRPVNFVSWADAARFCNWLQTGTTENGAYTLNGAITDEALMVVERNTNAKYFVPTVDEWYKAAFYDPNKNGHGNAGYWFFATKSDDVPSNQLSTTGTNNANFKDYSGPEATFSIGAPYYRTEVGAFLSSPGPYGTFDQSGNVAELIETVTSNSNRVVLGTSFADSVLSVYGWNGIRPSLEYGTIGFRIGSITVPEPSSFAMILAVSILVGCFRKKIFPC